MKISGKVNDGEPIYEKEETDRTNHLVAGPDWGPRFSHPHCEAKIGTWGSINRIIKLINLNWQVSSCSDGSRTDLGELVLDFPRYAKLVTPCTITQLYELVSHEANCPGSALNCPCLLNTYFSRIREKFSLIMTLIWMGHELRGFLRFLM